MGAELRAEVTAFLNRDDCDLTPAERLVLFVIADRAPDDTRRAYGRLIDGRMDWDLTRIVGVERIRYVCDRLAARGLDVREIIGIDKTGRPSFANRGSSVTYVLPGLKGGPVVPPSRLADAVTSPKLGAAVAAPSDRRKGAARTAPFKEGAAVAPEGAAVAPEGAAVAPEGAAVAAPQQNNRTTKELKNKSALSRGDDPSAETATAAVAVEPDWRCEQHRTGDEPATCVGCIAARQDHDRWFAAQASATASNIAGTALEIVNYVSGRLPAGERGNGEQIRAKALAIIRSGTNTSGDRSRARSVLRSAHRLQDLAELGPQTPGGQLVLMSAAPLPVPATSRSDVDQVCEHLADWIEKNGSRRRPEITDRWRTAARLMITSDGWTVAEIMGVIDWCQRDDFWRANILSTPKLREKYNALRLQAERAKSRTRPGGPDWDAAMARALAREADES